MAALVGRGPSAVVASPEIMGVSHGTRRALAHGMTKSKLGITLALLLGAGAITTLSGREAIGGEPYTSFGCGGNTCWGTLKGFRTSPLPTDWASFRHQAVVGGEIWLVFDAIHGRDATHYYCRAVDPILNQARDAAMSGDHIFLITWDANHNCNYLDVQNSSSAY